MENALGLLLGSTLLVSLITLIKDLALWKANRKATLEDKSIDRKDKLNELETTVCEHKDLLAKILTSVNNLEDLYKSERSKQDRINRAIITDRLRIKCGQILRKESITFHERKELIEMWNLYHDELDGNGNFDDIMSDIMNMPVDIEE